MTYQERLGHPADFEVTYRFLSFKEGGRVSGLPFQGYRCDWAYDGGDMHNGELYMIHPEFLGDDGLPIPMEERPAQQGNALMWIMAPKMREEIHQGKIEIGAKGYFMEGARRVGEATVTKVIGLMSNPIE